MIRIAFAFAFGSLVLAAAVPAAPRYSGTIAAVDPRGRSVTLKELGVGLPGGRNQEISRVIELSPGTKLLLAARAEDAEWRGGYTESPITAEDLRPGDFATIEAQTQNGKLVAITVVVVRPTGESR